MTLDNIKLAESALSELYSFQLRLSSGKAKLPTISEMAAMMGMTRAAIYDWAGGKSSSQAISDYLGELTGVALPHKLEGTLIHAVETLLKIRKRPVDISNQLWMTDKI